MSTVHGESIHLKFETPASFPFGNKRIQDKVLINCFLVQKKQK